MMLEQLDVSGKKKKKKKARSMLNLILYTKSNWKWIAYLNVRCKTVKLLEENMTEKLWDLKLRQRVLRHDTKITIHKRKKPVKLLIKS